MRNVLVDAVNDIAAARLTLEFNSPLTTKKLP